MKFILGGVCAAKGFRANGIRCGIRPSHTDKDLALVVSDMMCNAAAVYTTNLVKGAPIAITKENIADGKAQAIIVNSGNANTCNADGPEIARKMCQLTADALELKAGDIVIGSTGVIGQPLSIAPIENGMSELVKGLRYDGNEDAVEAIMTTDTRKKEAAVEFELDGHVCRIGGMAKGSGMIHPNMATTLIFITTDAAISSEMLQKALDADVKTSFNMLSIDGDTSTNDTLAILANGLAGNPEITAEGEAFDIFKEALHAVTSDLCRKMAADGEGATKMLECRVTHAPDEKAAQTVAKSVICSSLLKAAMFGADANWGRVLCAIGYAGIPLDVNKIEVRFESAKGNILVCENGAGVPFSEEKAKEILLENEIYILIDLHQGEASATAWGCDLTYDYVKINGDYRT